MHVFSILFTIFLIIHIVFAPTKTSAQVVLEEREPEAATGVNKNKLATANNYMVSAANPYAAWAGKNIIERGGSAIDAAIAVQAMLTLVEPQSSGIGGGAFIMYWDNAKKQLYTFDGRETAPTSISSQVFFKDGEPMKWRDAVVGGKSVGVPGVLRAMEKAHQKFGKLPWKVLFEDTIEQSRKGFIVSPRLARLLELDLHPGINEFYDTQQYFKPKGVPLKEGEVKRNPALADTLSSIASRGADAFYTGDIAEKISTAVRTAPINPGSLSTKDLSTYTAIERKPMCNEYREVKVCGMAPPSSGGVTVYQILKMLEGFDLTKLGPQSAEFVHLFSQASALAYADRNKYIADLSYMDMSPIPLITPNYIANRASQISLEGKWQKAKAGLPYYAQNFAQDDSYELDSTSHIAIVDKEGNAVSMTASIEFMFGSGLMVEGFLLNNQLTDFALNPMKDNKLVLNRVQPNKRPRSAMSPTMLFDNENQLTLVVGSPGGSRIINYVAQTIINVVDFGMDIQSAIDAPRITNRNDVTSLEKGTSITTLKSALELKGHEVKVVDLNSGIHGVQIINGKLLGGADPRREGVAVGQ